MPDINEPTEAEIEAAAKQLWIATVKGSLRDIDYRWDAIKSDSSCTKYFQNARDALLAARRVSSAPSFVVGIEAAAKVAIELGTAPLEGANIRIGIGNAIAAAIRALAHNPQASSGGDSNKQAVEFVARWAWREPSNPDKPISDAERLSAIKYHPTIKAAWSGAAEGNEAEAAAPMPDPAIAELVERLEIAKSAIGRLRLDPGASAEDRKDRHAIDQAIAALTASNDRVADLERAMQEEGRAADSEIDDLNEEACALENRLAAAEAEVSRLKAGAVTDEMVEAAHVAYEANVPDDYRYSSEALRAAIHAAFGSRPLQSGASK